MLSDCFVIMFTIISLGLLLLFPSVIQTWDLSELEIGSNYYASSIAVFRNRAFLALPRSACQNNLHQKTVVEVPWTGDHSNSIFRRKFSPGLEIDQEYGNCEHIQDAISLDIEPRKPRLWILDKGNDLCPPKVVGYNLFHNSIIYSYELDNVPSERLNILVVDSVSGQHGTRLYIGDPGSNSIIIFSVTNMIWWRIKLISNNDTIVSVPTSSIAVSENEPVLYITGENETGMFSLDLEDIRDNEDPLAVIARDTVVEKNVSYLGEKLGPSVGLVTDLKYGLSYYLVRDYAIVRWNTRGPLMAEYHDVLAQSYESLPYVSQLFTGPQNAIWALVNPAGPYACNSTEEMPEITARPVKIMKYNRREKKIFFE